MRSGIPVFSTVVGVAVPLRFFRDCEPLRVAFFFGRRGRVRLFADAATAPRVFRAFLFIVKRIAV